VGRRTHRRFPLRPIPATRLGTLLSYLSPIDIDGRSKYLYGSADALYPNQVYLHVKPGRVEGVPGGTYYYHPIDRRLVSLAPGVDLDRTVHVPFVNEPVFDEAAFSLFIVAQLSAIAPLYGDNALHFATIEAGLMTQVLETAAAEVGLGLCQIGTIEFDRVRALFELDETHVLVHSLLGGAREEEEPLSPAREESVPAGESSRAARIADRVRHLSEAEVTALLAAHRDRRPQGAE
jgi:SagB-type dehydrogenase family enzyme